MPKYSKAIYWLENLLFFWGGLTLILVLGGNSLEAPAWVQVVGRLHPLLLHFPLVILLLAVGIFWIGDKSWKDQGRNLLLLGANLAGITVVAGLILATEDYEGDSLNWHKWLGIISLFISIGIYFSSKKSSKALKFSTSALALVLVLTGHFGANLTHGEDFLFEPLLAKETKTVNLQEAEVFAHLVQPILETKCVACHKEGKIKGELRLDQVSGIQKGGKSGPFVVAGDPSASLFFQRIHLPLEDEEHMPPKNKAQLTDEEMEILEQWVAQGATFDQKVTDLPSDTPLFQLASNRFTAKSSYDFASASADKVEKLNNFFRKVKPIYPGSPALEVAYFGSSAFDPNSLNDLKSVKDQIVKVNLNRMPLQGVNLEILSELPHLEELQLNFTDLSSDQLKSLEGNNSLLQLAISGNKLGPEIIPVLESLTNLTHLYFWQSSLSDEEKKKLSSLLSGVEIDFGFDASEVVYQLNPPKIEYDQLMFENTTEISIKHPIPSVQIRYTLDETEPDSLNSPLYSGPFPIDKTSTIRTKAFATEWIGSEEDKVVLFKKGKTPKSWNLITLPNPKYKADGAPTLFDGIKGKANHTSGEWLGFSEQALELEIFLEENQSPENLKVGLLLHEGAYIFPPEKVEYWIGNGKGWKKLESNPPMISEKIQEPRFDMLSQNLPQEEFDRIKIKLSPIERLPAWHPGAGAKGWVFVDEIYLY
ncbi:c-type cytochrome domain-containing protein [Algoriphagus taiwanensis]|uniref:Chitobiase/beta-hexosaminidase C-terminal domain-containing protein n=1 Tax=Algoriphagus taiwanensis TaxID=1445656 RepID=A0ABQ6PYC8_9BACT|nr:chitobiase/beta-hexosaminidase C-terminal domain-containing protein [Algoriphagus taiwanensis]